MNKFWECQESNPEQLGPLCYAAPSVVVFYLFQPLKAVESLLFSVAKLPLKMIYFETKAQKRLRARKCSKDTKTKTSRRQKENFRSAFFFLTDGVRLKRNKQTRTDSETQDKQQQQQQQQQTNNR